MSASDLADEYNAVMADVIAVAGELWRTLAWRSTCELQNRLSAAPAFGRRSGAQGQPPA